MLQIVRTFLALVTCCAAIFIDAACADAPQRYDVVVYGATPAGVCAAVAARREGATVCIVEPLDLVGGMMSSGLSFSDSNQMARECLLGLFEEVHLRIEAEYEAKGISLSYRVSVKDQARWTYEPHVAEKVFGDLLREAEVELLLGQGLKTVEMEGVRIARVRCEQGLEVAGRVFIDASYEGDLMAAAGVDNRVGREGPATYRESLAGRRFPKPVVNANPWLDDKKLLPLVTGVDADRADDGDGKTMTYSFRMCLTKDVKQGIPIAKPAGYRDDQFALLRRYFASNPDAPFPMDLYPLPGEKLDGNNGIAKQISLGLVGGSWDWAEATPARRAELWREHRDYTAGLFWFLGNDPEVPIRIRDAARRLHLARDEFARFGHWPPVLYIREARRMVGAYVLTQADIRTNVAKPDAIAVGSFPIDSHDCQRLATADGTGFVNEGTIFPVHLAGRAIGQPYQIPYRSVVPQAGQCDNLLVPVCLSASHVAFSSVRVEPAWMVLGQSSGIAAALIAEADVAARELDYGTLRGRLAAQHVVVELPAAK